MLQNTENSSLSAARRPGYPDLGSHLQMVGQPQTLSIMSTVACGVVEEKGAASQWGSFGLTQPHPRRITMAIRCRLIGVTSAGEAVSQQPSPFLRGVLAVVSTRLKSCLVTILFDVPTKLPCPGKCPHRTPPKPCAHRLQES